MDDDGDLNMVTRSGYGPCAGFGYQCVNLYGIWRRQRTAYNDDESNWECLCEDCQVRADEYWDAMWSDYNSSRL